MLIKPRACYPDQGKLFVVSNPGLRTHGYTGRCVNVRREPRGIRAADVLQINTAAGARWYRRYNLTELVDE